MRILNTLICLWLLTSLSTAQAGLLCTANTQAGNFPAITLKIPNSLQVGQKIADSVLADRLSGAFNCDSSQFSNVEQFFGMNASNALATTIDGHYVYQTGINGIGYALYGAGDSLYCKNGWIAGNNTMDGDINSLSLCRYTSSTLVRTFKLSKKITFYKIGNIDLGTTINLKAGELILDNDGVRNPSSVSLMQTLTTESTQCSYTGLYNVPVPMNDAFVTSFKGKGSVPQQNPKDFTLKLSCGSNIPVSVTLTGTAVDASQGILQLQAGADNATGVGIQILYQPASASNYLPLPLGYPTFIGNYSGNISLKFAAQYIQTENKVTGGHAKAVATFTFTYQ